MLKKTGLTSCADIMCGSDVIEELAMFSGLSGGQRRRLSLAIALAKSPAVLMADEPTSGLDSAAAAAIMRLLGELARDSRVAVVCTIHQPSSAVFAGLDKLLLLTKGCTVYAGAASGLGDYLVSLKLPVPPGMSTVEHALQLTNADFTSATAVDALIDAWRWCPWCPPMESSATVTATEQPPSLTALTAPCRRAPGWRQLWLLYKRHVMTLFIRDPLKWIMTLVCTASVRLSSGSNPD